jgi:uncharacterized protein (DUF486 family)
MTRMQLLVMAKTIVLLAASNLFMTFGAVYFMFRG